MLQTPPFKHGEFSPGDAQGLTTEKEKQRCIILAHISRHSFRLSFHENGITCNNFLSRRAQSYCYLLCSHNFPVKPFKQMQWNAGGRTSWQKPLFWHGSEMKRKSLYFASRNPWPTGKSAVSITIGIVKKLHHCTVYMNNIVLWLALRRSTFLKTHNVLQ